MKLLTFAAFAALGYLAVMSAAPALQAKLEALDLDSAWDVFDHD